MTTIIPAALISLMLYAVFGWCYGIVLLPIVAEATVCWMERGR